MNHLNTLSQFLRDENAKKPSEFSSALFQDLKKNKQSLKQEGVFLDIEGVNIQEKKRSKNNLTTITYQGDFIYGFQKDGVFHKLPGDLSTQTERKINEHGKIRFTLNKNTGKIETIHESFAGNSWGSIKKKTSWLRITLIIIGIFIFWNLFNRLVIYEIFN